LLLAASVWQKAGMMAGHSCYDTGRPRSHDGERCYSKSMGMKTATHILQQQV
jgi:hypothetical protein